MFENREQAGAALADKLLDYATDKPVIYALPRGGLPIAARVADRLNAPLDIVFVRKIGAPGAPELAIGAIIDGPSPTVILHHNEIRDLNVSENYLENAKTAALLVIRRRRANYLKNREPISPKGRTVIIVDDGLATGATMEAAIQALRKADAKKIIAAVPVAPVDTIDRLRGLADDVVCLETPAPFWSVGGHYRMFPQLTDADVTQILRKYGRHNNASNTSAIVRRRKQHL